MTIHKPSDTLIVIEKVGGYRFEASVPPNNQNLIEKFENLVKLLLKETEPKGEKGKA